MHRRGDQGGPPGKTLELKSRGYVVQPDQEPGSADGLQVGAIKEFERHSRLGFVSRDGFFDEVDRLRGLGFKRITLKTGAYSMAELAMAIRYGAEAKIDLLTIDGAPGSTGMSPWPMMNEWGIPTFYLQALVYEFATKLSRREEGARYRHGWRLFHRGWGLQVHRYGRALRQSDMHGPGADDSGNGRKEHRQMARRETAGQRLQVR